MTPLSNTTLFLSRHKVQKRHKGAAIQIFFRFLPTCAPCQAKRVCMTECGKTQVVPTKTRKKIHAHCYLGFFIFDTQVAISRCISCFVDSFQISNILLQRSNARDKIFFFKKRKIFKLGQKMENHIQILFKRYYSNMHITFYSCNHI